MGNRFEIFVARKFFSLDIFATNILFLFPYILNKYKHPMDDIIKVVWPIFATFYPNFSQNFFFLQILKFQQAFGL